MGYVSQRGGFVSCARSPNMVLMGDATILRAYGLALLVAMIGVQALQAGGLVEIPIRPFHWLSNVAGGLIFGAGMMLGGGCSGSTWYRTGEARWARGSSCWALPSGPLPRGWFPRARSRVAPGSCHHDRRRPSHPGHDDRGSPWLVILVLAIAGAIWMARRGRAAASQVALAATGVAAGLLIAAGWWPRASAGRRRSHLRRQHRRAPHLPARGLPNRVNWSMVMLIACPWGHSSPPGARASSAGSCRQARASSRSSRAAFSWEPPPSWPKAAT